MSYPFTPYRLVLGSQSPRRAHLLRALGLPFRQLRADIDETHPPELTGREIAEYLARQKAHALRDQLAADELLITSDTVVMCDETHLAKGQNESAARAMLEQLSGRSHEVITGLCLASRQEERCLSDRTAVHFRPLSDAEIDHYLSQYNPYDKAGAYGIQEWIGMVGITGIEGSYFTVMGLPTHRLVEELQRFPGPGQK